MTRTREAMPAGIHHLNDERYVRVRRPSIANVHVRARTRIRPCALARRTAYGVLGSFTRGRMDVVCAISSSVWSCAGKVDGRNSILTWV